MLKSVFEFIIAFAENHFEKCINNCHNHTTAFSGATSFSGNNTTALILQFIEKLVALTCSTNDPLMLCRVLMVWNKLMSISSLKAFITSQSSSQCLKLAMHILSSCLLRTNKDYLFDYMNELINDLQCAIYADSFIQFIMAPVMNVSSLSGKSSNLSIDKVRYLPCMIVGGGGYLIA